MVKRDNINSGFTEEEKMAMAERAKELDAQKDEGTKT